MPEGEPKTFTILSHDGKAYGPVPMAMMQQWIREGRVVHSTPVLVSGAPEYKPAIQIADLQHLFLMGTASPPPSSAPGERTGPDIRWERREELGFFGGLFGTIKGVLFSPAETFRGMNVNKGYAPPLTFVLLTVTLFGWIALAYQLIGLDIGPIIEKITRQQGATPFSAKVFFAFGIGLMPILALLQPFIMAGIYHLCLIMFGGAQNGYEATYRVVAYTQGATAVWNILPVCGGFLNGIWALVSTIIGLREAHQTTTGRAVAAVLVPIVVLCGCICGFFSFIVFGAAAAAGGLGR